MTNLGQDFLLPQPYGQKTENNSPESCARLRQHAHCLGAQLQFIGEHIARVTGVVCPNLSLFEQKPLSPILAG